VAILLLGLGIGFLVLVADLGEPGRGTGQLVLAAAGLGVALCSLLPPVWIERLLLGAGGLLVGLMLAEIGLQVLLRAGFSTIYQVDSKVLYRHIPDSTKTFRRSRVNGGESVLVSINSMGYRGPEVLSPKRGRRILVYGDSFVAAEYSTDENTFVRRLENHLRQSSAEEREVVNAGIVGYGPDQVSLRMEQDLAELNPDLVIVAICAANDFGDLIRNKLYSLDGSGALEPGNAVLSEDLSRSFETASIHWITYKLILKTWRLLAYGTRAPKKQPELAEYQARRMEEWLGDRVNEYEESVVGGDGVVRNLFGDYYDLDISLTPDSDSARYKLKLMEQVLLEIVLHGRARGVPVLFVFIPADVDACHERDFVRIDRIEFPDYRRSALTDALESIAKRHSLSYLNLFQIFRDNEPDSLYFRGNESHWNDKGQDLAAKLVAEYLHSTAILTQTPNGPPSAEDPTGSARQNASRSPGLRSGHDDPPSHSKSETGTLERQVESSISPTSASLYDHSGTSYGDSLTSRSIERGLPSRRVWK